MKKLLIAFLFIAGSLSAKAQTDTTIVLNFGIQVKDWLICVPLLSQDPSDSMYFTYTKLRNATRGIATPSLTSVYAIDTIQVRTIAAMYLYLGNTAGGYSVLTAFQTSLTPYRSANVNLNRVCTGVEGNYNNYAASMFNALFKILRGY